MSTEISVQDSRIHAASFFKDIVSERCSRLPVEYPVLLEQGKILFPNATPELLLGGFHIHTGGEEKYQPIARYLQGTPIQRIGICHCTGVDQFVRFAEDFGTKVFYNYTGRKICF